MLGVSGEEEPRSKSLFTLAASNRIRQISRTEVNSPQRTFTSKIRIPGGEENGLGRAHLKCPLTNGGRRGQKTTRNEIKQVSVTTYLASNRSFDILHSVSKVEPAELRGIIPAKVQVVF